MCPRDVSKNAGTESPISVLEEVGSKALTGRAVRGSMARTRSSSLAEESERGLEGGWVQKRLFDIGLWDVSQCQPCQMEEGTEKHRFYHCPEWHAARRDIPEFFRQWEHKARTSKKEWKWQRGTVAHPLSGSQWNRGHFSVTTWESEKRRSWCMLVEGFEGNVADGSMPGKFGKWGACGWAVVQPGYDEEMGCMAQWRQKSRSTAPSRGRS